MVLQFCSRKTDCKKIAGNHTVCRTRFMKKICCTVILVLLVAISALASGEETGAWSEPVDGLRGRLIAKEGSVFHGTKMVDIYMELENVSDVGNPMQLY